MSLENTSYRSGAQVMPQLEQLPMDLVITPAFVLFRLTHNQGLKLRRYTMSAWISFSSEGPFATHQFSMQAKDFVWLEYQHILIEVVPCVFCGVTEFVYQGCQDDSFWIRYSCRRLYFAL